AEHPGERGRAGTAGAHRLQQRAADLRAGAEGPIDPAIVPTVTKLSVTVITKNEAAHIGECLASVAWADERLVVDSGSTAGTPDLARAAGARVIVRDWPGYAAQKNFAAGEAAHNWILSVDADERVTPALADEIQVLLRGEPPRAGYRVPRVTFHLGRWIRTTDWYPDYQLRLYDRRRASWPVRRVHESGKI